VAEEHGAPLTHVTGQFEDFDAENTEVARQALGVLNGALRAQGMCPVSGWLTNGDTRLHITSSILATPTLALLTR